jgi:hypothetical protein
MLTRYVTRELSSQERAAIRLAVESLVIGQREVGVGAPSGTVISEESAKAISSEYRCHPRQVQSIAAWVKIHAYAALKEAGLDASQLDYRSVVTRQTGSDAPPPAESPLGAAIRGYSRRRDALLPAAREERESLPLPADVTGSEETSAPETVGDPFDALRVPSNERADTLVPAEPRAYPDYRFGAKDAWRSLMPEFAAAAFPGVPRQSLRLLSFLGPELTELPTWDAFGLARENIVGVEGGADELRRTFAGGATAAGIQHFEGTLAEFLRTPAARQPFHIAVIDSHREFHREILEDMRLLPLADKAVLVVNFMAKRERLVAQTFMQEWAEFTSRTSHREFFNRLVVKRGKNGRYGISAEKDT